MNKTFYVLTIILFCFILFNCNNKKQNTAFTDVTENADSLSFDKFISSFSTDENFQFAHIKFPVEMFVPKNDVYNRDTTLYIGKNKWKFLNLVDSGKFPTANDVFFERKQYEFGFAIVVKGADRGILITYFFEKQNDENTWFLVKMEDSTM